MILSSDPEPSKYVEANLTAFIDQVAGEINEHREDVKRLLCEYFMRRFEVPDAATIKELRRQEVESHVMAVHCIDWACRNCGGPVPRRTVDPTRPEKFCTPECRIAFKEKRKGSPRVASEKERP